MFAKRIPFKPRKKRDLTKAKPSDERREVVSCAFTRVSDEDPETKYVLLGRHAYGVYRGRWGLANSADLTDRRSQRRAARLAEFTTLGLTGPIRDMEPRCKPKGETTMLKIQMYEVEDAPVDLPTQIMSVSRYVESCVIKEETGKYTIPDYVFPWLQLLWRELDRDVLMGLPMDPYSKEVVFTMISRWKHERVCAKREADLFREHDAESSQQDDDSDETESFVSTDDGDSILHESDLDGEI